MEVTQNVSTKEHQPHFISNGLKDGKNVSLTSFLYYHIIIHTHIHIYRERESQSFGYFKYPFLEFAIFSDLNTITLNFRFL